VAPALVEFEGVNGPSGQIQASIHRACEPDSLFTTGRTWAWHWAHE